MNTNPQPSKFNLEKLLNEKLNPDKNTFWGNVRINCIINFPFQEPLIVFDNGLQDPGWETKKKKEEVLAFYYDVA